MTDRFRKSAEQPVEHYAYEDALPAVRETISRTLGAADPVMGDVVDHLLKSSGKNIRATLLLASAVNSEGQVSSDAVIAAAALEILHLATLVHDDIVDDAPARRGLPSAQSQFGRKIAVLGGDYLFCVCFSMIAGLSNKYPDKFTEFTQAMTAICSGELRQYRYNSNINLKQMAYFRTIAGKTATLFSLAMYSGSILGGDDEAQARILARTGFQIGMLFQIADDCLDYESSQDVLKKTVRHDLADGIVTLPLILAFNKLPALKEIVSHPRLGQQQIEEITSAVCSSGAVTESWSVAKRYGERAERLILRIEQSNKRELLTDLLKMIESRVH